MANVNIWGVDPRKIETEPRSFNAGERLSRRRRAVIRRRVKASSAVAGLKTKTEAEVLAGLLVELNRKGARGLLCPGGLELSSCSMLHCRDEEQEKKCWLAVARRRMYSRRGEPTLMLPELTDDDLHELERLARAAPRGPFAADTKVLEIFGRRPADWYQVYGRVGEECGVLLTVNGLWLTTPEEAEEARRVKNGESPGAGGRLARYIAAATPDVILALLIEVLAARQMRKKI